MWNKREYYFLFSSLVFAFLFLFFWGECADHFWPHQHVLHAPKEKGKGKQSSDCGMALAMEYPFARVFCHVHFTFFPSPLCYFTCLANLPSPHCYYGQFGYFDFWKGSPSQASKEPIKSQKMPRKMNEKEKEGKEGAGAGGEECCL